MPKKILFVFAGTGDTAKNMRDRDAGETFAEDVVRVYFNGSQDTRIGAVGGIFGIAPDLDVVASKLRRCFSSAGELSINQLKIQFGDAILIEGASEDKVSASSINLTGFSRGAVTTFSAARALDDLGVPMSLFAQEPVPGNSQAYGKRASSEFHKNKDLSQCVNLHSAEVVLGVYSKNNASLQNKFFRQMVPIINPESCRTSIYLLPKAQHIEWNYHAENHRVSFYDTTGLRTKTLLYDEDSITDSLFFVPKIAQQKFHEGVYGRTQFSPRYKQHLLHKLTKSGQIVTEDMSVKSGQALLALGKCSNFTKLTEQLEGFIRTDTSNEGKALREFIVEFENINQYTLKGISDPASLSAINGFRGAIYSLIKDYPMKDSTIEQKQDLVKAILEQVSCLKSQLSHKQFDKLRILMNDFLENNILLHPDLAQYLDETETYNESKIISSESVARANADIADISDADALAERLYYLSKHQRAAQYHKFSPNLPHIVSNANQLGNILRLLPPDKIEATLKKKEMLALITSVEDIHSMMKKLDTDQQRKKLYKALNAHPVLRGLTPIPATIVAEEAAHPVATAVESTVAVQETIEPVQQENLSLGSTGPQRRRRLQVQTSVAAVPEEGARSAPIAVESTVAVQETIEPVQQQNLSPVSTGPQRRRRPQVQTSVAAVPEEGARSAPIAVESTVAAQETIEPVQQQNLSLVSTGPQRRRRPQMQTSVAAAPEAEASLVSSDIASAVTAQEAIQLEEPVPQLDIELRSNIVGVTDPTISSKPVSTSEQQNSTNGDEDVTLGMLVKKNAYELPIRAPESFPDSDLRKAVLLKLYKRLKEIPLINVEDQKTKDKYQKIKELYMRIDKMDGATVDTLLELISKHEHDNGDLFTHRKSNFFLNLLSIQTATQVVFHDIKNELKALKQIDATKRRYLQQDTQVKPK